MGGDRGSRDVGIEVFAGSGVSDLNTIDACLLSLIYYVSKWICE